MFNKLSRDSFNSNNFGNLRMECKPFRFYIIDFILWIITNFENNIEFIIISIKLF